MNIFVTNMKFINKEVANFKIKQIDRIPQIDFLEEQILCTTVYEFDNDAILYCIKNYKEEFDLDEVIIVADYIDNLTWLYAGCSVISSIECMSIIESKRTQSDSLRERENHDEKVASARDTLASSDQSLQKGRVVAIGSASISQSKQNLPVHIHDKENRSYPPISDVDDLGDIGDY